MDQAAAAKAAADARMKALTDDLRDGRVDAISGWLKELHTALPPHVAGAMIGSIRQWKLWAASPMWQGAPLDWQAHGREVEHALTTQGQRWRLLLTGQVNPLDQMSPDDYVQAAGFFVGRVRQILQRLIAQYWPWVAVATLVMIVAVVASLFAPALLRGQGHRRRRLGVRLARDHRRVAVGRPDPDRQPRGVLAVAGRAGPGRRLGQHHAARRRRRPAAARDVAAQGQAVPAGITARGRPAPGPAARALTAIRAYRCSVCQRQPFSASNTGRTIADSAVSDNSVVTLSS